MIVGGGVAIYITNNKHIFLLIKIRRLTLGGIIIGAPGGKNGIGGIIGICGGKDIIIL